MKIITRKSKNYDYMKIRSPRNFDAVLGLYRIGKLHLSQGVSKAII